MGKILKHAIGAVVTVGLIAAFGPAGALTVGSFGAVASAAIWVGGLTAASFLMEALGPKPKGADVQVGGRDYRQPLRQAVVPKRWVYGRARLAGVLCYTNEYTDAVGGDTDSRDINKPIIDGKSVTYREGARRTTYRPSGKSFVDTTNRATECYEYRDVVSPKGGNTVRSLTWGPCTGASGQQSAYVPTRTNQAALKGTEGLFLVLVLSEGAIDGIDKIWVDGAEMPFSESNGVITPTAAESDDVKFKHEGKDAVRMYLHRGEASGSALNRRWGRDGVLQGISAVGVELAQFDTKPWTRAPGFEFAIRGVRMTWPGQTTPTWSENAAAVRYHYLVEAKEVPKDYIDETRFRSAYTVCNQAASGGIRYSINGVVSDDEDYDSVTRQMDFAWAGSAPEINGKIVFTPGAPGSVKKTLDQDDLVAGEDPAWQIETPIYEQADAVDAVIAADVDSDYLPYSMARVGTDGLDKMVNDLGRLQYVGHQGTAHRLMDWSLKHAQQQRRARVHVRGQDGLTNWSVTATDRVVVNIPDEGISNERFTVEAVEYALDGTLFFDLAEEPSNLYTPGAQALTSYIEDTPFVTRVDEPTNLSAEVVATSDDTSTWSVIMSCAESPNGEDLQIRFRYSDSEDWTLGGTGATLRRMPPGALQIGARIVGREIATEWTADRRVFRVTLASRADPANGPQLSLSGDQEVEAGEAVRLVVRVILEDAAETYTFTLTNKPAWLSTGQTARTNNRVEEITLTGTMTAGTDVDMLLTVTDGSSRSSTLTIHLEEQVPALEISGIGDKTISSGIATTIGTATTDSSETINWAIRPAVSGVSIGRRTGVVTATLSTLGDQAVTITATERAGNRRTASVTITLSVIALSQFGVEESNPVMLFHDGADLLMGGVDNARLYALAKVGSVWASGDDGASGLPAGWERASSDGTYTLAWSSGGLRRITNSDLGDASDDGDAITYSGYPVAAADSSSDYRYLAVAGGKLYAVAVETETTYRTETYQSNCRTDSRWVADLTAEDSGADYCTSYTGDKDKSGNRPTLWRCRYDERTCDTLTRRIATTTTRLVLYVSTLATGGAGAKSKHTIESTTGSRSYTIHGIAIGRVGTTDRVYILMTRAGTKGIWRCTLTGGSFSRIATRSESNPVDMAGGPAGKIYILDRGADRVNEVTIT